MKIFPWLVAVLLLTSCATPTPRKRTVWVGVIGGMMKTGLWPELAAHFEADSGYQVQLALSGNRDLLDEAFRAGELDLVSLHRSDVASNLVSEAYARKMRTWTRNEFVVVGPRSDPAGIRGLRDGAEALKRIAQKQARLLDYQNSGPRDIMAALWSKAGISPQGVWLIKDASDSSEAAMKAASERQAYVLLGRLPSIPSGMEILVQGDADMQREFVVLEANPKKVTQANARGAQALADYLLSGKTQRFLLTYGSNSPSGMPLFYPVKRF